MHLYYSIGLHATVVLGMGGKIKSIGHYTLNLVWHLYSHIGQLFNLW